MKDQVDVKNSEEGVANWLVQVAFALKRKRRLKVGLRLEDFFVSFSINGGIKRVLVYFDKESL